jgi:hypothetical protein
MTGGIIHHDSPSHNAVGRYTWVVDRPTPFAKKGRREDSLNGVVVENLSEICITRLATKRQSLRQEESKASFVGANNVKPPSLKILPPIQREHEILQG